MGVDGGLPAVWIMVLGCTHSMSLDTPISHLAAHRPVSLSALGNVRLPSRS